MTYKTRGPVKSSVSSLLDAIDRRARRVATQHAHHFFGAAPAHVDLRFFRIPRNVRRDENALLVHERMVGRGRC